MKTREHSEIQGTTRERINSDDSVSSRDSRFSSCDQGFLESPIIQKRGTHCVLPPDFLRVPKPVIDQWWEIEDMNKQKSTKQIIEEQTPEDEFELVSDSEDEDSPQNISTITTLENASTVPLNHRYTVRIVKDDRVGLGLQLKFLSKYGPVVHSVSPPTTTQKNDQSVEYGIADKAGIQPGDILVSVNGSDVKSGALESLSMVASLIKNAPTCFSLTLDRPPNQQHLADSPFEQSNSSIQKESPLVNTRKSGNMNYRAIPLAPLATLLHSQGLLESQREAEALTSQLYTISTRSRRWQKHKNLIVDVEPPSQPASRGFLSSLLWGSDRGGGSEQKDGVGVVSIPTLGRDNERNRVISMHGIREALVIRVLGISQVNDHTEYIVWVLDVASGIEWKISRRFREFQRLEEELFRIRPSIRSAPSLDFPLRRLSHIYESIPGATALERAAKLSRWLRHIVSLLPGCGAEETLIPSRSGLAAAAAVQRFLEATREAIDERVVLASPESADLPHVTSSPSLDLDTTSEALTRVVHVFAHRILNLPVIERAIGDFISRLGLLYESQCRSKTILAFDMGESLLAPMGTFISLMETCILKGCDTDLRSYLKRHLVQSNIDLPPENVPEKSIFEQSLLRGVRRAVESEVYIPLMGKLHRSLLGVGALDEDSIKFDRRRLRSTAAHIGGVKRQNIIEAQVLAGIQRHCTSPTGWQRVTKLLNRMNKGPSLPCDRIQALVKAGREIPLVFREEHRGSDDSIGADDILPIFIFALARSDIRDLVAVRRMLQALCDDCLREGEEGYYLATLGAATDHIIMLSKVTKKSPND